MGFILKPPALNSGNGTDNFLVMATPHFDSRIPNSSSAIARMVRPGRLLAGGAQPARKGLPAWPHVNEHLTVKSIADRVSDKRTPCFNEP